MLTCCRRLESAFQIGNQIFTVFNTHGNAQQALGDAGRCPRLRRHAGVGHGRCMRDQAFYAAQRFCQSKQLKGREKTAQHRFIAVQFKTQHRAETALLPAGDLMPRILRQGGMIQLFHQRLLL